MANYATDTVAELFAHALLMSLGLTAAQADDAIVGYGAESCKDNAPAIVSEYLA